MTFTADPRVDAYIDVLPEWQQAICREVRELVHAADPDVVETIKRTVQPYFVLEGNICALLAAKDHVNVFLYDGGIVPDPEANDEGADLGIDRWPAGAPSPLVCPLPTDQLPVPAEQRLRPDHEVGPEPSRQGPAGRREQDPVCSSETGALDLSAKHSELVPEDE